MAYPVSKERFAELAEAALATLPPEFAEFVDEVPIEILDHPTRALLRSVDLEHDPDGQSLLGLYHGRPRTERHVEEAPAPEHLDVIYLFQRPIESICDDEEELMDQVRITLLHEIGHHFGMDEEDLDELGYG